MTAVATERKSKGRHARSRAKDWAAKFEGVRWLGEIVTWDARAGKAHKHTEVVQALTDVGLDPEVARKLLPRHAFNRASKKLAEERVIDFLKDDLDELTFQFTKKFLDEGEWEYKKETLLTVNKTSGKVTCKFEQLQQKAQAELDRCMEERNTSDITKIVQTLFEEKSELIPVRANGGVYIVPDEHREAIAPIAKFLERLGGRMDRIPIPAGTPDGDAAMQDKVASALEGMIADHIQAVEHFATNTRPDTIEKAAKRIQDTRIKIEAYAHYLHERQGDLLKAVDEAKDKLAEKMEELAGLRAAAPEGSKVGRTMLWDYLATAVIRWMGKQGWDLERATKALEREGVTCTQQTIKDQLIAGKNGLRGDPAPLTKEQIKKLSTK